MAEKGQKMLRVYADGVYDGFHIGHSNMLKQCRETFPDQKIWLIAGVCDQHDVEEHKGTHKLIEALQSAHKRSASRWCSRTATWTKCCPTLHGLSTRVFANSLRVPQRHED